MVVSPLFKKEWIYITVQIRKYLYYREFRFKSRHLEDELNIWVREEDYTSLVEYPRNYIVGKNFEEKFLAKSHQDEFIISYD